MLVVEPEKRYTLKQISQHRWMQCRSPSINEDCCNTTTTTATTTTATPIITPPKPMQTTELITESPGNLDSIVVNHMLQLPNLTFDEIAESVHQNTFNHIYAIYNLLVDKLQAKRNEQQRLQHHASLGYTKYVLLVITITTKIFLRITKKNYMCNDRISILDHEKQVLQREWLNVRKH